MRLINSGDLYPAKVFLLFILTGIMLGCGSSNKVADGQQEVKKLPVIVLKQESVTVNTAYPARIEGKVNVDIRPQVEGYIDKIFVEEGQFVKAGQPLLKINDRPYVEQLNTAKANLDAAKAALKTAGLEVEKFTTLSQNNVTSDFQLKSARAAYENAEATVSQQKANVASAKINLDFTLIKAPVSGFTGRFPKRLGNLASRSDVQPLTTLSDISSVYAYFSMTERDFLRFNAAHPDQSMPQIIAGLPKVSLLLADGNQYTHEGKIQMVDGQFDVNTGAVSIRAVFENPKYLLRSGNTGRITLPQVQTGVVLVPVISTIDVQNKIFAFRLAKDNVAERVALNISGKSGDNYLVKSGLKAGDTIIAKDIATLTEGEKIQPEAVKP